MFSLSLYFSPTLPSSQTLLLHKFFTSECLYTMWLRYFELSAGGGGENCTFYQNTIFSRLATCHNSLHMHKNFQTKMWILKSLTISTVFSGDSSFLGVLEIDTMTTRKCSFLPTLSSRWERRLFCLTDLSVCRCFCLPARLYPSLPPADYPFTCLSVCLHVCMSACLHGSISTVFTSIYLCMSHRIRKCPCS